MGFICTVDIVMMLIYDDNQYDHMITDFAKFRAFINDT